MPAACVGQEERAGEAVDLPDARAATGAVRAVEELVWAVAPAQDVGAVEEERKERGVVGVAVKMLDVRLLLRRRLRVESVERVEHGLHAKVGLRQRRQGQGELEEAGRREDVGHVVAHDGAGAQRALERLPLADVVGVDGAAVEVAAEGQEIREAVEEDGETVAM